MPFVRRKRGQVLVVHNHRDDGKIRQEILHRFAAPAELEAALGADFEQWQRLMTWRHPGLRWSWKRTREALDRALAEWSAEPASASQRRDDKLTREARGLLGDLEALTRARPADRKIIRDLIPTLSALRQTIDRLAEPRPAPRAPTPADMPTEADEVFDAGMEHWWVGERTEAKRFFKRALRLDPLHADAHNHLAIDALDAGRLDVAERHLDQARRGGERALDPTTGDARWDMIEHRPYLRALMNLALLRRRQERYPDALRLHQQLAALDPALAFSLGSLIADELHRQGQLDGAAEHYERHLDDPGCGYSLALLRFQQGRTGAAGIDLVRAFAGNRYIAPMLLGLPWKRLQAGQRSSFEEPERASDYLSEHQDLWRAVPDSAAFLARWWNAIPVRQWLDRVAEVTLALSEATGDARDALTLERDDLISEATIRDVAETVEPGAANVPPSSARLHPIASPDEVRIERSGDTAIIHFADARYGAVQFTLGDAADDMSDADVLELHNDITERKMAARAAWHYVATEIPPGRPQLERARHGGWEMRGEVVRALIEGHEDGEPRLNIDGRIFTLAEIGGLLSRFEGWGLRLTVVPDDEMHEPPEVRVGEPEIEQPF